MPKQSNYVIIFITSHPTSNFHIIIKERAALVIPLLPKLMIPKVRTVMTSPLAVYLKTRSLYPLLLMFLLRKKKLLNLRETPT